MNRRVIASILLTFCGVVAALVNIWVYSLGRQPTQFLLIFVGLFIAGAGLINVRRYWQRG